MIIISPGHYASSPGARYESFSEYPETKEWARKIYQSVGESAIYVGAQTLVRKVQEINNLCAHNEVKIALEIHFNSAVTATGEHVGEGSETLYCPGSKRGREIAEIIQPILAKHFPPNRGVKEGFYRRRKLNGPLYFLKETRCPAIIIEPEFVQFHDRIEASRRRCCTELAEALLSL